MISQTSEYALRAMVDLCYHQSESRTTQEIAQATQVPAGYLAKVLKDLARQGLIQARRGPNGGFSLEHDPTRITVYDVFAAVDPPRRITKCPLNLPEHRAQLCPLHQRLDDTLAMVEKAYRDTTIAEITAPPQPRSRVANATLTISGGLAAKPANSRKRKQ